MSSPIYVPFNNNPNTIEFKNSSYTVPAGKYVYAQLLSLNGVTGSIITAGGGSATVTPSTATIDSEIVAYGSIRLNQTFSSGTSAVNNTFTIPDYEYNGFYNMHVIANGPYAIVCDGDVIRTTTSGFFSGEFLTRGTTVVINRASGGTNGERGSSISLYSPRSSFESWLPSGTIIAGTVGYSWMVEVYNV